MPVLQFLANPGLWASLAAGAQAVAPALPDRYKVIAQAIGLFLTAVTAGQSVPMIKPKE